MREPRNVAATSGPSGPEEGAEGPVERGGELRSNPLVARERDRFVQELERAGVVAEAGAEAAGERDDAAGRAGGDVELVVQVDVLLGGGERGGGIVALECPGESVVRAGDHHHVARLAREFEGPFGVGARLLGLSGHGLEIGEGSEECGFGVGIVDGVEVGAGLVGDLEGAGVVACGHLEDHSGHVRRERVQCRHHDAVTLRVLREFPARSMSPWFHA